MKRHPVVESISKSLLLEEDNFLQKEAEWILYLDGGGVGLCLWIFFVSLSTDLNFPPFRKARHPKGSRWEAKGSLRALPPHLLGNKFCFSVLPVPEPCLCGCSLRTKAVLHPRPPPVSRPASQVLPSLSAGKKQLSPPLIILRAQLSQSSPKPKAKVKSQLLSWDGSRTSCNAVPLRKLVPMGVWPQGLLDPLPQSLPDKLLHTLSHWEGAVSPAKEPSLQWYYLWGVTNPSPLNHSCLNKNVFSKLWSFFHIYWNHSNCLNWEYILSSHSTPTWVFQGPDLIIVGVNIFFRYGCLLPGISGILWPSDFFL